MEFPRMVFGFNGAGGRRGGMCMVTTDLKKKTRVVVEEVKMARERQQHTQCNPTSVIQRE